MMMRGGCFCENETAAIYDANRAADLAMAKKLIPDADEMWVEDSQIIFKMVEDNGTEWFGSIGRRDPQWFTRRK
jgi:hypothetical protein